MRISYLYIIILMFFIFIYGKCSSAEITGPSPVYIGENVKILELNPDGNSYIVKEYIPLALIRLKLFEFNKTHYLVEIKLEELNPKELKDLGVTWIKFIGSLNDYMSNYTVTAIYIVDKSSNYAMTEDGEYIGLFPLYFYYEFGVDNLSKHTYVYIDEPLECPDGFCIWYKSFHGWQFEVLKLTNSKLVMFIKKHYVPIIDKILLPLGKSQYLKGRLVLIPALLDYVENLPGYNDGYNSKDILFLLIITGSSLVISVKFALWAKTRGRR